MPLPAPAGQPEMPRQRAQADDEVEDVLRRQRLAVHRDAADRERGAPAGVHERLVGNIRACTLVFT
jgi:hypothetical protein